jgi:hypothetical protein
VVDLKRRIRKSFVERDLQPTVHDFVVIGIQLYVDEVGGAADHDPLQALGIVPLHKALMPDETGPLMLTRTAVPLCC